MPTSLRRITTAKASLEKGDSPRGGEMPAGQRGPLSTRGTAVRRWRDFPVKCSFQGSRVKTVRRNSLVPRCLPWACQRRRPITSPEMLDFMEELLGMCRGRCPHRPAETVSVHLRSAASRAVVSKPFGGIRSFLAVRLGLANAGG